MTAELSFDCSGKNLTSVPRMIPSAAHSMWVKYYHGHCILFNNYCERRNLSGNNITALVSPAKDPFRASFARFRQLEHL